MPWRPSNRLTDFVRQWPWVYPRGIEDSARSWITGSQRQAGWYAGLRGNWCVEMFPEGFSIHPSPPGLPESARPQFYQVASMRYPASAVFHFSGASLVADEGLIVTPDNRVLAEFYHQFGRRSLRAAIRSRPFGLASIHPQRTGQPIGLLAAPQGKNYYHWLLDVLPRVHLLKRWDGVIEKYAVPEGLSDVQIESLQLLGIGESKLLRLQPTTRLRCQQLYAPSLPGSEGCYPPWARAFLQETFLPLAVQTAGQGSRIYVRRGLKAQRPVQNEAELIAELEQRGFHTVSLETLSFLQQVAVFRDARLVVAAHGAGLANLVFSHQAALLELFSPEYLRPDCFFTLARQAGHRYDCWLDQSPAGAGRPWGAITVALDAIATKIAQLEACSP